MKNTSKLPLSGVRVVDFGQQIVAPAVAMTLGDLGATVIHIDPPSGPQWNHPANAILNRNKLCLKIDLKSDEGLAQAMALIAEADVVIESFRPGVMKRLGIDLEELREIRPELITLSTPGFASNDELRNGWKATEAVVAATSGAFTDMGFNRVLMGVEPSFSPVPLGSSYATTLAAASIAFALIEREKTGRGDSIEVPIASALMEGLSYNSYLVENLPERYKTMREHEIAHRRENNIAMDLSYDELQEYLDPFYRTYECADGRMFYCVCPSHRNHAKRALQVLGIYDELIAEGLPEIEDLHQPIAEWEAETSIGVYPQPKAWADRIAKKMKAAFLKKTAAEWGVAFGEGQIPGAPHQTMQEWIHDEHSLASGLFIEVDDPEYGLMKQPGPIAWFEENASSLITPSPRKNVSFDEALATLQRVAAEETVVRPTGDDIHAVSSKGWLDGFKVLDLTNVIAGPHSGSFLTRFGAEVTKLDPVTPLYDPLIGILYSFQTDMGKRKVLVDINTPEGREALDRAIKASDLVLINAPERQMKPLKLDHESLQAVHPGVLFCRLDCFGGPLVGPKTNYIGYDDIIQANSGIMSRFGGVDTPEEHAHIGTIDVNCGFAAGLSMALAIFHKMRTGEISRARTSLSAVTNLAQIPFAFDYEGRAPFDEPSGREALGNNDLSHFYQTQDGWIFLDSNPSELAILETIPELATIRESAKLKDYLVQAFKNKSSAYWEKVLHEKDIAAAVPISIGTLRENYSRVADGRVGFDFGSYAFSIYPNHPSGHCLTAIDHYAIRSKEAHIKAVSPTERFGASTIEILNELGFNDAEIDSMIEKKIAGLGWGREFLPS